MLELKARLPKSQQRFHSGKIKTTTRFDEAPEAHATGLTIEQTLEDIEHSGSFVALQHIESDPEYKPLVEEVQRSVLEAPGNDRRGEERHERPSVRA